MKVELVEAQVFDPLPVADKLSVPRFSDRIAGVEKKPFQSSDALLEVVVVKDRPGISVGRRVESGFV